MKLSIYTASLLLGASLMQGCGGGDTKNDTPPKEDKTIEQIIAEKALSGDSTSFFDGFTWDIGSSILDWWNSDGDTEQVQSLTTQLSELAQNSENVTDFTKNGLRVSVEYVVKEYIPIGESYLLDNDWGDSNNQYLYEVFYDSSETLVGYMDDFYNTAKSALSAPAYHRAAAKEEKTLIEKIIDEIYNLLLQIMNDFFFGSDTKIIVPDMNDTSPKIDPNQTFTFKDSDINGDVYYVASEQYMTVTFEADGASGYGDIGYGVGADFNSSVSGGKLFINMNGDYEVEMKYRDPGYCIASEMTDTSDGSKYPAFWFSDPKVYDKATNLTTAESLCYIHSTEYAAKVIAKDGELEPILDSRASHTPVAIADTSTMVTELTNGVDNTATVTDAKYFARKMRHGIFSIYTTNGQTHTLQATETEKVTRELLPLAASSAIAIDDMLTGAYDSSIAFQEEVNKDLNNSMTDINNRVNALIIATSQAMDRTTSATNYHGVSDKTIYGDTVDFEAKNKNINLFSNTAKADVVIKIMSDGSAGRTANVEFITKVTTTVFGNSDVKFSEIDATSSSSYIGGSDYNLNIKNMKYTRADGLMQLNGNGYLGSASKLTLNNYKVLATFQENPDIKLLKFSVEANGDISTPSGRVFNGTLVFDGDNTNNSQMNGTLVGINDEPTITGAIQTSLSSEDITAWVASHDSVSASDAGDLNNMGDQSYSMNVSIAKPGKTVSADMLVKRDNTAKTWTYIMKDLAVSDANVNLTTQSVYLVQNGDNTLVETFEKLAINGLGLDSDINALVNFGWDVASDFSKIGIKGLNVTMKPASGDVDIKATINVLNNGATMSADMSSSYNYATTHLTSVGKFSTLVDASSGKNVYNNNFTTAGLIKVDNKYDYNYKIAYTDTQQDMLFTSNDSNYQMGFRMTDSLITGGDSYGVLATFKMNATYDVMEQMELRNRDNNPLGIYIRSEDPLKIKFVDKVEEYMYLY